MASVVIGDADRVRLVAGGRKFESIGAVLTTGCSFFRMPFAPAANKPLLVCARLGGAEVTVTQAEENSVETQSSDGDDSFTFLFVLVSREEADGSAKWCFTLKGRWADGEFLGNILSFLRKAHNELRSVPLEGQLNATGYELRTVRWKELTFIQQKGLATLVQCLGVWPLKHSACGGAPTADKEMAEAPLPERDRAARAEEAAVLSPVVGKAVEYVGRMKQQEQVEAAAEAQRQQVMGDDTLNMAEASCQHCGINGHDADSCPHFKK